MKFLEAVEEMESGKKGKVSGVMYRIVAKNRIEYYDGAGWIPSTVSMSYMAKWNWDIEEQKTLSDDIIDLDVTTDERNPVAFKVNGKYGHTRHVDAYCRIKSINLFIKTIEEEIGMLKELTPLDKINEIINRRAGKRIMNEAR